MTSFFDKFFLTNFSWRTLNSKSIKQTEPFYESVYFPIRWLVQWTDLLLGPAMWQQTRANRAHLPSTQGDGLQHQVDQLKNRCAKLSQQFELHFVLILLFKHCRYKIFMFCLKLRGNAVGPEGSIYLWLKAQTPAFMKLNCQKMVLFFNIVLLGWNCLFCQYFQILYLLYVHAITKCCFINSIKSWYSNEMK